MSSLLFILLFLGFLALIMAVVFGVMLWNMYFGPESRRLEVRLQALGSGTQQQSEFILERHLSKIPVLNEFLAQIGFLRDLDKSLVGAGHANITLDRFLLIVLILAFTTLMGVVSAGFAPILAVGASLIVMVLPFLYLRARVRARATKFEEQLPDVLEFIARAMQAGHAFGPAIQMAASESPEPIAGEFSRTQSEINFGVPVTKALADLAERIGSADMRFFAVAVAINREVGGDLAGLLEGIASLIRERVDMRTSVIAMTAEGRFSALMLALMPFGIAGILMVINPEMIKTLWTHPTGRNMVFAGLGLMAVGGLWMRSMIKIKV